MVCISGVYAKVNWSTWLYAYAGYVPSRSSPVSRHRIYVHVGLTLWLHVCTFQLNSCAKYCHGILISVTELTNVDYN